MALKLGKCRLCLKLGDFYSIFTIDNSLQLSEMVMECTRVKIYEGDGLPDKVCSECVQKLSSAYIFKQQCERSDQELRRNYIAPPGFSITPPPPNRQSSDSAFSSSHTDVSSLQTKTSSAEKARPASRSRKRSRESAGDRDGPLAGRPEYRPSSAKRVDELRSKPKKPRVQSPADTFVDSDYEDNSMSHFSPDSASDSEEPLADAFKCKKCPKEFKSQKSLNSHMKVHGKDKDRSLGRDQVVDIPKSDAADADDVEDKLRCDRCHRTFKLQIMLKRHAETCGQSPAPAPAPLVSPQKELLVSLEPIDSVLKQSDTKKIDCEMCTTKFKTVENLEKHMRVVHAAVSRRRPAEPAAAAAAAAADDAGGISLPCLYCGTPFEDYYVHSAHLSACERRDERVPFQCPLCDRVMAKKASYLLHVKNIHFWPRTPAAAAAAARAPPRQEAARADQEFECRMCNKKLPSQDALITHLAAHMSSLDDGNANSNENDSRSSSPVEVSVIQSGTSTPASGTGHKCKFCDKSFKYKKALQTHTLLHTYGSLEIKAEPPDRAQEDSRARTSDDGEEGDSSGDGDGEGDDNTCDICEKQFSYRRLLAHHKRTKHNMSSGHKRAKVNLKDCPVRCLICDIDMKVSDINEHNQTHISRNMKPRNQYTCADCGEQFKSCSGLATHIKLVHRLKQAPPAPKGKLQFEGADLADFCEVVVTKAEPLDEIQSHNDFGEVPVTGSATVDLAGFSCHVCGKKMKTLVSLRRHVNWHLNVGNHLEKPVECFVCKETFRFQRHYKLHMRAHYRDPALDPRHLTCPVCQRRSKHLRAALAHMNYHKQTRFKANDYQCSICKRVFQYRKVYLSHMAIHYKRGEGTDAVAAGPSAKVVDRSGGNSLACPQCGKVCDSENSLKCHVRWHTSKSSLYGARYDCHICNLVFTNKRSLELHTRVHFEDDNGPFKCGICGKGYIDEEYYRRHVKGHNFDHQNHQKRLEKLRKDKVKCPICTRYYPNLVKLIGHLKRTHPESKMIKQDPDAPPPDYFTCKLCNKIFLEERRLRAHEAAHARKPTHYRCRYCGHKSASLKHHNVHVKRHLYIKHHDNRLQCTHCEETFLRHTDLNLHLRTAHDIKEETWISEAVPMLAGKGPLKEFQCSICHKLLASRGNFERHIDYHNSLRCNYCFEYFSNLKFLEGHLAFSCDKKNLIGETEVHPKKVKCHVCYKAFHLQVKLDCHLRTQHDIRVTKESTEGRRDIVCDYCFKVFENDYALSMHKIYHRTIGYYGCIYCPRKFNTLTLYRKHKNHHYTTINQDNPTKCEHCDETFVAFRDMIYHMRDEHGDDKEWIIMPKESIEEKCHICNKTFFNLHRHLMYHEDNKCKKCGEYFYSRSDYDQHLCSVESDDEGDEGAEENPDRPKYEECVFCFKPITKSTKVKHEIIHRTSGAISCRFCPLKFKTMDAFNIHAFSHRSRKYNMKPIKCRICREKFTKYGPFMKHMKSAHQSTKKVHYRAVIRAERCVVCGQDYPNLHNHYRHHLQHRCLACGKYFTSSRAFSRHRCDQEDPDPTKVFTSDENLDALIKSYIPRDEKDDEKFYGYTDDEEDEEAEPEPQPQPQPRPQPPQTSQTEQTTNEKPLQNGHDKPAHEESLVMQPFIISDVLSLYEKKAELLAAYKKGNREHQLAGRKKKERAKPKANKEEIVKAAHHNEDSDVEVVALSDEEPAPCPVITLDDDDD